LVTLAQLEIPEDGKLSHNITHFGRALRRAGLPVGPGRVLDAVKAVEAAGFTNKQDFYWSLHACFVTKREQHETFDQIFRLFWRDPRYLEHMMSLMLPSIRGVQEERAARAAERRASEALLDGLLPEMPKPPEEAPTRIDIDATATTSGEERLRTLDFEQMSNDEMAEAKRLIAQMALPIKPMKSRRTRADMAGQIADWRGTVRRSMRQGGEIYQLSMKTRRRRWPDIVALCDISGSMSQYSRVMLHFLHTAANRKGAGWSKVHAFTFGTQLTNITRQLTTRDVDVALKAAGTEARDWDGGTRIGECLHVFNRDWSRRVLGPGAVVILITDGLERDKPDLLAKAMERLSLSARRLIWVNPLLRWDGFAPKAQGVAAMLPHVTSFRAGHNINSLAALVDALSRPDDVGQKARMMQLLGPVDRG